MLFSLLECGLYGIGMVKNSPKLRFEFEGKMMTTGEIFKKMRYSLQECDDDTIFFSVNAKAYYKGKCFDVKLVFTEAVGKKGTSSVSPVPI